MFYLFYLTIVFEDIGFLIHCCLVTLHWFEFLGFLEWGGIVFFPGLHLNIDPTLDSEARVKFSIEKDVDQSIAI